MSPLNPGSAGGRVSPTHSLTTSDMKGSVNNVKFVEFGPSFANT
jgi:hypothetical protein